MTKPDLMEIITKSAEQTLAGCHSGYTLEIWSHISDKLDITVRRAIGDKLQAEGRNRYTGRLLPSADAPPTQGSRCSDGNT